MTEPTHGDQQATVRRSRLVVVTLAVVLLGALCAVIPPVAPLGFVLCALAIVPAVVGYVRVSRRGAAHRGQALGALILAPTFFLVSFVVVGLTATPTPATAAHTAALASAAPAPALPPAAAAPAAPVLVAAPAPPLAAAPAAVVPTTPLASVAPPVATTPHRVSRPSHAPAPAPAPATSSSCDEATHYINSSHACVPRPVAAASEPAGATARCNDGTYWFSQHHQGTCSSHRGVASWL
jgi:hypothetical protein